MCLTGRSCSEEVLQAYYKFAARQSTSQKEIPNQNPVVVLMHQNETGEKPTNG